MKNQNSKSKLEIQQRKNRAFTIEIHTNDATFDTSNIIS